MCIFSQEVESVFGTNIFARGMDGKQFLFYSMNYAAAADLAMVLPLPLPTGSAEDAVRFINLQGYPDFFDDMDAGFPDALGEDTLSINAPRSRGAATLQVHDVGDFAASIVPQLDDFDRLDRRFRIPRNVWDRLPAYRDYGFAVFKLKGSSGGLTGIFRRLLRGRRKPRRVHPMALEFPRKNADLLYFPTVHIHDRVVHTEAAFDHMLYCQTDAADEAYLDEWEKSTGDVSKFMDVARAAGVLVADRPCWRMPLRGELENRDTLIGKNGSVPVALKT
jgi:hypothetical protein